MTCGLEDELPDAALPSPPPTTPPGSPSPARSPPPAPLLSSLSEEPASPLEEYKRVEPLVREPLKAGSAYFLINRRWYTEWLQWVGHPCVQSPKQRPVPDPLLPESPETEARVSSLKRTRAHSWIKDRPGQIDNTELLEEGSSTAIKRGLDERSDYELVPEDAWNLLLSWYGGGPPIKRRAIELPSGGVQVELYGLQLKVYKSSDTAGTPLEVTESKCMAVKELKASLCEEMSLDPEKTRIWDYFNNRNYALLEKNADKSLESCRIFDQNPILLEEQNPDGTWPYQEGVDESGDLGGGCSGSIGENAAYSSADVPSVGEPLQRGAVGLQNLGNTCFMNSSIQCLSNIPPLREFFLTEEYKDSLNRMAYKTKGKLAEAFAQLLSLMWRQDTRRVAPRNFKYQVGQFAEQFSGYGQQDSMELIEYVLDGLKEDCNLVQGTKPYTEVKEAEGRPDEEVATEALEAYRKRSNSRVDDLFVGLFKSVVRCPEPTETCGRESVTFDPFLSAKLPLVSSAEQRQTQFSVTIMRDRGTADGGEPVIQVQVKVSKDQNMKALIEAAAKEVEGLEAESCVLIELWNKKVHQFFEDTAAVESIPPEDILLLCEVANAKAFQVSTEQRWGSAVTQSWSLESDGSPSAASLCGAILHHRQANPRSWSSYTSRELHGLPMLLSVPKASTGRSFCAEVARRLDECVFEANGPKPSWKICRVDKWSPTADGTAVDPESDDPLDLKDGREYFAVEWEEGAALPARLMREEPRPGGSSKQGGEQDLRLMLRMFVEDERLGPDDAWYCNRCKSHKEAWKKLEFHRLPPVLVLQLKRFQYTRWSRERLNTPVSFPLEGLDLGPYCTTSSQAGPDPQTTLYDLAALSKHIGSLGGGHYVAYCRSSEDGEWYNFDDGSVCRVNAEEVEADKVGAYVLFYIRRDYRPSSYGPPPTPAPSP